MTDDIVLKFLTGWTFSFILISTVILCIWVRSRRPRDLPPGPTPFPIIGNILFLLSGDLLSVTRKLKKYGSLCSLSVGPYWAIFLNDSQIIHKVFVKHADKFSDRPDVFFFKTVLEDKGIAATSGQSTKAQRTFALNALRHFGFGKRSMEYKVIQEIGYFIKVLDAKENNSICIEKTITKAVSNITCSLVFGERFKYEDPVFLRLINDVDELVSNPSIPLANFTPQLHSISKVYDVFGTQKMVNCVRKVKDYFAKLIEEHKKTLDENDPRDFVDAYLIEWQKQNRTSELETQFKEDNLEAVLFDLFAAGTETTSSAIGWGILFLMNNPDIQEKMRTELVEVVGADRQPLMADRNNLPYCESVICETLRLGNIAPQGLPHTATEDFIIEGYRIPKGSIVIPNLNATMHDEQLFPDSDEFDPTRFFDENGKHTGFREKFFPFSLGRRVCLGESLARMQLFLFLTAIVRRFKILPPEKEPTPKIKGRIGLTHSPASYKVRFVEW